MPTLSHTIALSRQQGSGGSYIGHKIADRLGLLYVDRQMLRYAAEFRRDQDSRERTDTASSWWSLLGQSFAVAGPNLGYPPPSLDAVYEGELFGIEERLMRELVDEHAAVIVGRGAAQRLRGRDRVLSVFLHAPEEWRITRVQQIYQLADRRAAQQMVRNSDRDRGRFTQSISGLACTDVRGYDLALDTAAIGVEAAVDLIVRTVEARAAMGAAGTASA